MERVVNSYRPVILVCIIAMTITVVIATGCIGIALRHTHEGGRHHHSHGNSHGHSHSHSHSHRQSSESHRQTHIHITVFGVHLTVLCSSDDDSESLRPHEMAVAAHRGNAGQPTKETLLEFGPEASLSLYQSFTFVESVIPGRIDVSASDGFEMVTVENDMTGGRCRDLPPTPPPELA